jgi:hypothetical protein
MQAHDDEPSAATIAERGQALVDSLWQALPGVLGFDVDELGSERAHPGDSGLHVDVLDHLIDPISGSGVNDPLTSSDQRQRSMGLPISAVGRVPVLLEKR